MKKDEVISTTEIARRAKEIYRMDDGKREHGALCRKIRTVLQEDSKLPPSQRRYPSYEPATDNNQRHIKIAQEDAERLIYSIADFCIARSKKSEELVDGMKLARESMLGYQESEADYYDYLNREAAGQTFACEYEVLFGWDKTPPDFPTPTEMMAEALIREKYRVRFGNFNENEYRKCCQDYYQARYDLDCYCGGQEPNPNDEEVVFRTTKLNEIAERLRNPANFTNKER